MHGLFTVHGVEDDGKQGAAPRVVSEVEVMAGTGGERGVEDSNDILREGLRQIPLCWFGKMCRFWK